MVKFFMIDIKIRNNKWTFNWLIPESSFLTNKSISENIYSVAIFSAKALLLSSQNAKPYPPNAKNLW